MNTSAETREPRALLIAFSVFLLIAVGRVGELIPGLNALPLARISMAVTIVLLVAHWGRLPKIGPVARPLVRTALSLALLALLTAPFSIWLGASAGFLYQQLPVLVATVLIGSKLAGNAISLRKLTRILVISGVALALSAVAGFHGGRASSGVTYDTNDLAYVLVTVAPLAFGFMLNAPSLARRLANLAVFAIVIIALLLTASRGGFLGLVTVLLALILMPIIPPRPQLHGGSSRRHLIPALVGVIVVSTIVWPYLPLETRNRLATIVSLSSDYNLDTENEHSRSSIWERNFSAALRRPIGYGVAAFPMVDIRTGGKFMAPHNSYLQILVELGFVGVFLFFRVYVLAWRALGRLRHSLLSVGVSPQRDQAVVMARCLQISLLGNAVAGFFLSMAYSTVLWTVIALVIGCLSGGAAKNSYQTTQAAP